MAIESKALEQPECGHMPFLIATGLNIHGYHQYFKLKYEIVQKWKNTFTFGLNAAENMQYSKKSLK